jgi:hypothetical protein
MMSDACKCCEGWGKECDMCRVGIFEENTEQSEANQESIGELLVAAFSENGIY